MTALTMTRTRMGSDMATIVWLIGAPGAGKTTLVRALLLAAKPSTVVTIHKPKWTLVNGVLVLAGHYTGETFDGADRVGYNAVNAALDYWFANLSKYSVTIFDGDRFSHEKVWHAFEDHNRMVVQLKASNETLNARRQNRGSNQNEIWLKGRASKVENFAQRHDARVLDAEKPTSELLTDFDKLFGDM